MDLMVVLCGILPRDLLYRLTYALTCFLSFNFHLNERRNCNILSTIYRFKVIVIQAIRRFRSIICTVLIFRTIRPGSRANGINNSNERPRDRTLRQNVSPQFVVKQVSARILTWGRIVVVLIRSTVIAVLVTECGGCFRLVFKAVTRARMFRRVRRLIIHRVIRPINSREALRQFNRLVFTLRTLLRILTKISRPTKRISGHRCFLLWVFVTIRPIR